MGQIVKRPRSPCKVCRHPDSELINSALVGGMPGAKVAARFTGLSSAGVHRHAVKHVPGLAAGALAKSEDNRGARIVEEVEIVLKRIRKMSDACDEYLQDPENPEKYYLGPRADEVDVVYETWEAFTSLKGETSAKRTRTIKPLSEWLDELAGLGGNSIEVRQRYADPRRLLLDAAAGLHSYIDVVSRISDQMREAVADAAASREWAQVRAIIMRVLDDYPDAKEALMKELAKKVL